MKQKTRKILSRIGAAFMLGMSLFNFGAIWTRQQLSQAPKRTKNIRQKEQIKTESDEEEIATIAEKHAEDVISSEQIKQMDVLEEQEAQQQLNTENGTVFQKTIRYVAVTVWTVTLGLIFSSVLLDYPISFGKGILSVMPGAQKNAKIILEPASSFFQKNESIKINVLLQAKGGDIKDVDLAIKFDPKFLEFESSKQEKDVFRLIDTERIDDNIGLAKISFSETIGDRDFTKKEKIAELSFLAKSDVGNREVSVLQNESNVIVEVIQDEDKKLVNVLGETRKANFSVLSEFGKEIRCGKLILNEDENLTRKVWGNILIETKLPKDALIWQEVGNDRYFICGVDSQSRVAILVKGKSELKKSDMFVNKKRLVGYENLKWQEGDFFLSSNIFNLRKDISSSSEINNVLIHFNGSLSWPKKGLANFQF